MTWLIYTCDIKKLCHKQLLLCRNQPLYDESVQYFNLKSFSFIYYWCESNIILCLQSLYYKLIVIWFQWSTLNTWVPKEKFPVAAEAECWGNYRYRYNTTYTVNNNGTDQTGRMCWLICASVVYIQDKDSTSESPHDKTKKMTLRPAKTQIRLGIRQV